MTAARVGFYSLLAMLLFALQARAEPAGSAFTFQGRLLTGGAPAVGNHDMTFTLHSHISDASLVGSPLEFTDVPMSDGIFIVQLDFGSEAFSGESRWLQIEVGGVPLAPRQPLTTAPHAVFASRPWAINGDDVSNSSEGKVGIGTTTSDVELEVAGAIRASGEYEFPGGSKQSAAVAPWATHLPTPQQIALLRWYEVIEADLGIPAGNGPYVMAFDGAHIWVTNSGGNRVTKLRAADGASMGSFAVGAAPEGVVFDGAHIWVSNLFGNNVMKLRASDGANVGTFSVGSNPAGLAFDGANIWTTRFTGNNVRKLRASDGANLGTFNVGTGPRAVEFDGANIWVANSEGHNVTKLRASDGTNLGTFAVGLGPTGLIFDGANIWVTNRLSNNVTKLRASDGASLGTFSVGMRPAGVAFDGHNVWVANSDSNSVTRLRASDGANLGTVKVGPRPWGVAFDGANIWVANSNSNTLSKR